VDVLVFVGLIIVAGSLGGITKILSDVSSTLKRIEERMAQDS
jgi:hypothetical protein